MKSSPQYRYGVAGRINIVLVIVALLFVWLVGWWVYDRFLKSDETRIRQLIASAADGARRRAPSAVTAILSEDFRGPEGVTRDIVHAYAVNVLMQHYRFVQVQVSPDVIPVQIDAADKTRATAVFKVQAQGRVEETTPWEDIARAYCAPEADALKAYFKRTDDGWKMTACELESRSAATPGK